MKRNVFLLMVVLSVLLCACLMQEGETFIDVNGVTLSYLEQGSGKPLILLHGGGGSCHDFEPVMEELAEEYKVLAVDSRGHGKSSKVEAYHYQDMAEDIAEFIRKKELKGAALYGFSDGGIVGLLLASQYPDLISCMVISGANADPHGLRNEVREAMEEAYRQSGDGLLKMEITEPHITKEELKKIHVPVLLLAGSDDLVKASHTKYLAAAIPKGAYEILEGESHSSYIFKGEELADRIRTFCKAVDICRKSPIDYSFSE